MEPLFGSFEEMQKLPGVLLWRVSKLWQSELHTSLAELDLSGTNAFALSNILQLELDHQEITQARLASLSNIDRMTISTILRGLIAKGFVEREVHGTDKRGFALSLTSEGREVAREALQRIADVHQKFFGSISDKELTQLTTGLSNLLDANTARS